MRYHHPKFIYPSLPPFDCAVRMMFNQSSHQNLITFCRLLTLLKDKSLVVMAEDSRSRDPRIESSYHVIINTHPCMACLTLNRQQRLMVGR